jgi:hypothetical protein
LLVDIIDNILPVVSGRDWRLQKGTNQHYYELYCQQSKKLNEDPVSFTTFCRYLTTLKIHKCTVVGCLCQLCLKNDEEHKELKSKQSEEFFQDKIRLKNGEIDYIVMMDFSCIQLLEVMAQDLVVVIYTKGNEKIDYKYYHIIGEEHVKK